MSCRKKLIIKVKEKYIDEFGNTKNEGIIK